MVTSTRYSTDRYNKLACLIGVCVDSTSRVAKISLHESKRRFHAVFNGTFQLIGLLIKEGIVLEVKETAFNFCRLQPQDVVRRSYWKRWWTLIVSQQHLRYILFSIEEIIDTYKSSRYFLSAFISKNFVAITAYWKKLEYPGFWASHLDSVLESFHRASNVDRILGTNYEWQLYKTVQIFTTVKSLSQIRRYLVQSLLSLY